MRKLERPGITGLFSKPISLASFLDEIPIGVVVLDGKRRVVHMNRALEGLTGVLRREAKGIGCPFIVRSGLCIDRCPLDDYDDSTGTVYGETDIISRDRQKIPVRMAFSAVKDLEGKTVGYIETIEDMRFLQGLDKHMTEPFGFGKLIGRSPTMERVFRVLPAVAESDSSVLITGETGTGKDLVAEAIHQASPRSKHPFIKVNCGALPETLMESELFGHQKGAFTGAFENKPGRFRLAHNGTLYLTEIGDLPLSLQVKLLTFLDDRVIYPLGSTRGFQANVRIVCATHRNLERMVAENRFREDLLFRLNVVRLHLPPLRDRGQDVGLLLDHFLLAYLAQFKKPIKGFTAKALKILLEYSYPGNVRELRNIVEYGLNVCWESYIDVGHLPAYMTSAPERVSDGRRRGGEEEGDSSMAAGAAPREDFVWSNVERRMILDALKSSKGRKGKAAELLGWGRSTLWRKMKEYGIGG